MEKDCPVLLTTSIIHGKWKVEIILMLGKNDHCFGEIKKSLNSITQRSLTLALRGLEKDGIVEREVLADKIPVRVCYRLTPLGKTLLPVVQEMYSWGEYYRENS